MSSDQPDPTSIDAEDADHQWSELLTDANRRFLDARADQRAHFPSLTAYELVDRVATAKGTFAWHWGAASEVRECINLLNAWAVRLHQWRIWNATIKHYDSVDDQWSVLSHFVEPVAFYCMLQPSAMADRFTLTAETLLHQANRRVSPSEPDRLDQDKLAQGKTLRRSDRRKQLNRLGAPWKSFAAFKTALAQLDGQDYRAATRNYRDLAAHSFAPRMMLGHVSRAIRSMQPWTDLVEQPDGTFVQAEHPTKRAVSYAMHDAPPLDLDELHRVNDVQYRHASEAMARLEALAIELCGRMDAPPEADNRET